MVSQCSKALGQKGKWTSANPFVNMMSTWMMNAISLNYLLQHPSHMPDPRICRGCTRVDDVVPYWHRWFSCRYYAAQRSQFELSQQNSLSMSNFQDLCGRCGGSKCVKAWCRESVVVGAEGSLVVMICRGVPFSFNSHNQPSPIRTALIFSSQEA